VALAECRRFPTLTQALVARSALEAAGLHPFIFDEHRASVSWTEQFALGGIRVMAPEEELSAARALLAEMEGEPAPAGDPQPPLFLLLLVSCVLVGWPIAGFRMRDGFHRATAWAVSLLLVFLSLCAVWGGAFRLQSY
jgi:hypothetical protein